MLRVSLPAAKPTLKHSYGLIRLFISYPHTLKCSLVHKGLFLTDITGLIFFNLPCWNCLFFFTSGRYLCNGQVVSMQFLVSLLTT